MKKLLLVLMLLAMSSTAVNAGKLDLIKKVVNEAVEKVGKLINDHPITATVAPMVLPSAIEAAEDVYDDLTNPYHDEFINPYYEFMYDDD